MNKTFLKRSLKNIKRLEVLVTDLVDISRIETGELIMNMSQVDILTLIEEMVSDANSTKKNSKIDIKINNNLNEKVFVNADPDRIHQVFNNLLSNAIRYTDEGQIAISIEKNDNKVYIVLIMQEVELKMVQD